MDRPIQSHSLAASLPRVMFLNPRRRIACLALFLFLTLIGFTHVCQAAYPTGEILDKPRANETETVQAGGPDGYYTWVGALRCQSPEEVIVGLQTRRSSALDYLQILCARIECRGGRCGWTQRSSGRSAGASGAGQAVSLSCQSEEVLSGYRATVKNVGGLNYVEDIAIQCAKVSGRPASQSPWAAPVMPQSENWRQAQGHLAPGAGAHLSSPGVCPSTGASAVSVAVGRYGPSRVNVVQAMSLFCGKAIWPAPYNQLSASPPETCRPYLEEDWREFEKCLLLAVELKPNRLPSLTSGQLEAWGRSNPGYNCYAYAAAPYDPGRVWVGPRQGPSRPADIPIPSPQALITFLTSKGWQEMTTPTRVPPSRGEERVVFFANSAGGYEHAAFWDERGILAKMGELGVFRFSSLDQMVGPAYGRPTQMFRNAPPTSPFGR
ncbi:MAG: hypothetical protein WCH75_26250 [Candidatus Binatia bacterium]